MNIQERIFNISAGLSILSWAALGLLSVDGLAYISPVRICIALLHSVIGCLVLIRNPIKKSCRGRDILMALPSMLIGGFAFKFAPAPQEWRLFAEFVFIIGTCLAIISILYLWKFFAIFPAFRGIMDRGPYSIVRHPAYVGEFMMVLACFMASPTLLALVPFLVILPSIILRICAEENMLAREPNYQTYTQRVAWRLLPGVW